jgi:hypothetical protein
MKWLWTWSGRSFGYRRDDLLFTQDGQNVGYFKDDELYSLKGQYLGELRNDNRLITSLHKNGKISHSCVPQAGSSYAHHVDYVGYVMYAGYEDFPEL